MDDLKTTRIVLLGKCGTGKSSLANTIFGEEIFARSDTCASGTSGCQAETKVIDERSITLIDTPGFFGAGMSEDNMRSAIFSCFTQCAPGPHALLIVLKVEKFTQQEEDVIKKISTHLSEDALKYAVVVFTHGEQLPVGTNIETFFHQNKALSNLVKSCGDRCHVLDNKYWKENKEDCYRSNQFQAAELLKTVHNIVEANNGRCYTNEVLKVVNVEIQKEEAHIQQSSPNMSQEEIKNKAEMSVSQQLRTRFAGLATGALWGALFGAVEMISKSNLTELPDLVFTASGRQKVALAALRGAAQGSWKGFQAAGHAKTQEEAMEKATGPFLSNPPGAERQNNTKS